MRAEQVVADLVAQRRTVAVAESLTGGLVCAALTAVPGSSAVVRGGVVAYATDVKESVLGIDADVVRRYGVVSGEAATVMAANVRRLLSADIGVATTGVAGPDWQEGKPVGTVYVAVVSATGTHLMARDGTDHVVGDRGAIRDHVVDLALSAIGGRDGAGES